MCARTVRRSWSTVMLLTFIALVAASNMNHAQDRQTRQVMRQKLEHSQALLAALVTSNWGSLDRNSRALELLTMEPGWQVLRLPEFNKYTNRFQRSTAGLVDAARARNGDAALPAYNALVASCVECHRYVARSRIARKPPT